MKLPNAEGATIAENKIVYYLLDSSHPAGGSKAVFFLRHGFFAADWLRVATALAPACARK